MGHVRERPGTNILNGVSYTSYSITLTRNHRIQLSLDLNTELLLNLSLLIISYIEGLIQSFQSLDMLYQRVKSLILLLINIYNFFTLERTRLGKLFKNDIMVLNAETSNLLSNGAKIAHLIDHQQQKLH
jgi:hypothetical protein